MNLNALKCLLAALCMSVACDPTALTPQQGLSEDLAPPPAGKQARADGCSMCIKWSAKPPGGTNGPPWSL